MVSNRDVAHLVRERETYRHLDLSSVHGYLDDTTEIPPARPSRHSALTAFAQLCILRLRAHRAFVSLFDRRYQYVIAETTASAGLRRSKDQPTEDGLLLCGLAFPHAQGVSSLAIEIAAESLSAHVAAGNDESQWKAPVVVVPDLSTDVRFSSSGLLKLCQDIRFYASVPIRTSAGSFIGVVTVTDDKPRPYLSDEEEDFFREIAQTVMDYLTTMRSKREEARCKRMIRGLGSFVEGRATMSGLAAEDSSAISSGGVPQEGLLNETQQLRMHQEPGYTDAQYSSTGEDQRATSSHSAQMAGLHDTLEPVTSRVGSRRPSASSDTASSSHRQHKGTAATSSSFSAHVSEIGPLITPTASTNPPIAIDEIPRLFSRAANTIRESIEVEGALFFDASVSTVGDAVDTGRRDSADSGGSHPASDDSSVENSSVENASARSSSTNHIKASYNMKTCAVLGFSTTETSSINGDVPTAEHLTVPERFLRLLLRRYPMGKIFSFDERGIPVSDSDPESDPDHPAGGLGTAKVIGRSKNKLQYPKTLSRNAEPSFIIQIFPGARSVLAFPLWDSHRSRWYAGGVVWTRTPSRIFSIRGELSYLRAFGATIMAELSSIEQQKENLSKTDVLGSISHELRTPLHGILGGAELLLETDMDVFQHSTVHTIARCGTTLLDTVDHLLDYAKVNNLLQTNKAERQARRRRGGRLSFDEEHNAAAQHVEVVDVDLIIEEVVESLVTGHEFESLSRVNNTPSANGPFSGSFIGSSSTEKQDERQRDRFLNRFASNPVNIILDIHPAANWKYETQAGALRRIVMNIFGNALKFTELGQITVTLVQRDLPGQGTPMSEIEIMVADTGRGIGAEYLAYHLYTPFSQEDTLTPGIGLGLSTTRKLVTALGGNIMARSQVGQGSSLTVVLPLHRSASPVNHRSRDNFEACVERLSGLRVSLLGFDEGSAAVEPPPSEETLIWKPPRFPIEKQCRDLLHMEVLPSAETAIQPDIYLVTPDGARDLTSLDHFGVIVQPVIILCPSAAVARNLLKSQKTTDRKGVFEYISQPCGPRKLALTFVPALDRWAAVQVEKSCDDVPTTDTYARTASDNETTAQPQAGAFPIRSHQLTTTSPMMPFLSQKQSSSPPRSSPPPTTSSRPAPSPLQQMTSATPTPESPPAGSIAPYLVVDDNAINVKLLTSYLNRRKLPVAVAQDGVAALEAYTANRGVFSCIFMDIQMPRLDGIGATRAIREYEMRHKLEPVYVVVLTGLATKEKLREAKANGANEFFPKPVKLRELNPILTSARRTIVSEAG